MSKATDMPYPIPLVAPDVLWLSHGTDIAPALNAALTPQLQQHGYQVRDLDTANQPLLRAQAVFHDIRTLLREIDSVTALWAWSKGHLGATVIGLAEPSGDYFGPGFTMLGVPMARSAFRLFTLHRHLHSDWPPVTALYRDAIAEALPGWDIAISDDKLSRLQAEADNLLAAGLLPAPVDVRRFAVHNSELARVV